MSSPRLVYENLIVLVGHEHIVTRLRREQSNPSFEHRSYGTAHGNFEQHLVNNEKPPFSIPLGSCDSGQSCDGTERLSLNFAIQDLPLLSRNGLPVDVLSVQCWECSKWRTIPTEEEYDEIRSKLAEDPFVCSKKPGISCDDPADLEYNDSKTWVMDRPNIPKTPSGFKRRIVTTNDFSKMVCYYDAPNGKRLGSWTDVLGFLDKNPEYKNNVSVSDFSFLVPNVRKDLPPANPAKE
ncbi:hypothetical protein BUALT_Bualt02G0224700 [Buddleja alternifolia]|uniref:Uncharacterized protein n=1 Tax=Buddleja alternifolia TaxID=168488 RepID=A0AAV6YD74_9LAMI|nr:hypothetical protein BUALT_Bualt02G0224700 [Buddleja alternifolia]